jgi:isopenicillin N synthase-like dioxygenase
MDPKKRHGVRATNRDHIDYDQVEKTQTYHLAEQGDADEFDEDYRVRTCDVGGFLHGDDGARRRFADELGTALADIGFAILVNQGTDPALYDEISERTQEFFTTLTLEQKMRYRATRHGSVNQGYFPIHETTDIHPDLVEGWVFCRRAFAVEGRRSDEAVARFWPDVRFEPAFRRLVVDNERLIAPVMQSLLLYLDHDPHLFDARLTRPNIGLRLNYYPPLDEEAAQSGAGRLLGHEDVGMFTLLPAPEVEGLQVLNRRSMKWVRMSAPRGSMILNTGDYVQRITNDVLPSTTHRVGRPRDRALLGRPRVSFPMNVYVWEDVMLEVLPHLPDPKYTPIRAIEFHTRSTSKFYGDDYAVTE